MTHEDFSHVAVLEPISDELIDSPEPSEDPLKALRIRLYDQAHASSQTTFAIVDDVFPLSVTRTQREGDEKIEIEEPLYPPDVQRFLEIWLAQKTDFLLNPDQRKALPDLTRENITEAYDLDHDEFLDRGVKRYSESGHVTETTILGLIGELNAYASRLKTSQDSRLKLKPRTMRSHKVKN